MPPVAKQPLLRPRFPLTTVNGKLVSKDAAVANGATSMCCVCKDVTTADVRRKRKQVGVLKLEIICLSWLEKLIEILLLIFYSKTFLHPK